MPHEKKQLELRRLVRSVVAEIRCKYNRQTKNRSGMVGIILEANKDFCYLMVKRSLITNDGTYTIYLPDGSSTKIGASEFVHWTPHKGFFAGCYIYHDKLTYDINKIAAVQFGEDVAEFDEVHLCEFCGGSPGIALNVTGGRVLDVDEDDFFMHDCGPGQYTCNGAPVFCEKGKLVGVCVQDLQGVSTARNVSSIERNLNYIYETQTIEDFRKKVVEFGKTT